MLFNWVVSAMRDLLISDSVCELLGVGISLALHLPIWPITPSNSLKRNVICWSSCQRSWWIHSGPVSGSKLLHAFLVVVSISEILLRFVLTMRNCDLI
jgi:hypothetical protein